MAADWSWERRAMMADEKVVRFPEDNISLFLDEAGQQSYCYINYEV
jgi:hypothetical protein